MFPLVIFLAAIFVEGARAQTNGELRYQSNILEFFDGGGWQSMDVGNTGSSCASAKPGEIQFNVTPTPDRLEFCNATNWRQMDFNVTTNVCSKAGEMDWLSSRSLIRYCNGANWVETAQGYTKTVYLTSGTSWTVPDDWNSANNAIETIGGGGGGAGQGSVNQTAGGGGGAYSKISNLSLVTGASVSYVVGTGGAGAPAGNDTGTAGGDTWFNGTSLAASSVSSKGGAAASGSNVGSGGGTSGQGTTKYAGGSGGDTSNSSWGGAGGGGAGGPNGAGARGGNETAGSANERGGTGGGGGGGGSTGGDISSATNNGSAGGNNSGSSGGGAAGAGGANPTAGGAGSAGGGGGGGGGTGTGPGTAGAGGSGGTGSEWDATHGSGGGGGGGGSSTSGSGGGNAGNGGLYGGGGGGGGTDGFGTPKKGGDGAQGIIRIRYAPAVIPNYVQEAETVWNSNANPKTTGSFNVQAGDVLVAYGGAESGGSSAALNVSGGSLTWNLEKNIGNSASDALAYIWTAVVDTNKSMTVTFTRSGGGTQDFGGNVLTFRNSGGVGASVSKRGTGAPSVNITTTQNNSAIVVFNADWAAADGGSRAWRINGGALTEASYTYLAGVYTIYGGYHVNAGPIGTYAVGLTAPNTQDYSMVAVEIKGR